MKFKLLGHEYESRVEHFTDLYQGIVSKYDHSVDSHKIHEFFEPILSNSHNLRKIKLWPEKFSQLPTIPSRKREVPIPIIEMVPCPHLELGFSFYYDCGYAYDFKGAYSKWDKKLFDSRIPGELIESVGAHSLREAYDKLLEDGLIKLLESGMDSIDETICMLKTQAKNLELFKGFDSVILKTKKAIKQRKLL